MCIKKIIEWFKASNRYKHHTAVVACISLAKQVEKLTSEITKLKGRIKKLEEPSSGD